MRKRLLWVGEAPYLKTGYGIYTKNVLSYLSSLDKYDIVQLAVYGKDGDPRNNEYPWTIVPNEPEKGSKPRELYDSQHLNQFGVFRFENLCADYKPDVVLNIADFWMFEFIFRSPYKKYFKTILMPTCDATPQPKQWTDVYTQIDKILAYNDWSGKEIVDRLGPQFSHKYIGSAPPVSSSEFVPMNRHALRQSLGMGIHETIFGTVMRNQKRKLFPILFEGFRNFLDQGGHGKLVCHTSYPDRGWDIQALLKQYNLPTQVYFTYICMHCGNVSIEPFKSIIKQCSSCNNASCKLCTVDNGVESTDLAKIYNVMDLYFQPCTNEGFGMPLVEAAACGTPIAGTNYSAPEDILNKLNGIKLNKTLYTEGESGMYKAIPHHKDITKAMLENFHTPKEILNKKRRETRELFEKHYNSWKVTGQKWENAIDSVGFGSWNSPIDIKEPKLEFPEDINSPYEASVWIIKNVLRDESKLYTLLHARIIRDLSFGFYRQTLGGEYDHEITETRMSHEPIDIKEMINVFANKRSFINECEKNRVNLR